MGADLLLALLLAAQLSRPTLGALTFLPIFEAENPEVKYVAELKRLKLAGNQDLVVMLASPYGIENNPFTGDWLWPKEALLGVFLQSDSERKNVTTLTFLSEPFGSYVRVDRARENELVLSRTSDFGPPTEHIKLFFDIRQKKLVAKTSYLPFMVGAAVERDGVVYLIAQETPTGNKLLVLKSNAGETGFEVLSHSEMARVPPRLLSSWDRSTFRAAERLPLAFGPDRRFRLILESGNSLGPEKTIRDSTRRYALPPTTMAEFVARRTDLPDVRTRGWQPAPGNLHEEIGPHQLWGDKLWFGKTFYGGEGYVGVGGFGYFDGATGTYTIFSPPELWRWSVSALLVESDAVWLGLVHRGEYGGPLGGLLRLDRVTQKIQKHALRSMANAIVHSPNALYVATRDGIAVLRSGRQFFEYYIVDVTATGAYRVVPAF